MLEFFSLLRLGFFGQPAPLLFQGGDTLLFFQSLLRFERGNALLCLLALLLFQGGDALLLFLALLLFQSGDALLLFLALLLFQSGNPLLFFLAFQFISPLRVGFFGQPALLFLTDAAPHLFAFPGVALQQAQPVAGLDPKRRRRKLVCEIA